MHAEVIEALKQQGIYDQIKFHIMLKVVKDPEKREQYGFRQGVRVSTALKKAEALLTRLTESEVLTMLGGPESF